MLAGRGVHHRLTDGILAVDLGVGRNRHWPRSSTSSRSHWPRRRRSAADPRGRRRNAGPQSSETVMFSSASWSCRDRGESTGDDHDDAGDDDGDGERPDQPAGVGRSSHLDDGNSGGIVRLIGRDGPAVGWVQAVDAGSLQEDRSPRESFRRDGTGRAQPPEVRRGWGDVAVAALNTMT